MLVWGLADCTICDCAHSRASSSIANVAALLSTSLKRVSLPRTSSAFWMRRASSESPQPDGPQPCLWALGPFQRLPLFEAARRAYVHGATARAHVGRQARPARGAARDSSHHSPIKENCRGLGLPDPINHVYSLPGKYI